MMLLVQILNEGRFVRASELQNFKESNNLKGNLIGNWKLLILEFTINTNIFDMQDKICKQEYSRYKRK